MNKGYTTVAVSNETYSRLISRKISGNISMETIIKNMLNSTDKTFDPNSITREPKERILLRKTKRDINRVTINLNVEIMHKIENMEKCVMDIKENINHLAESIKLIEGDIK